MTFLVPTFTVTGKSSLAKVRRVWTAMAEAIFSGA